jgi:hypothetical protein
MVKKLFLFYLIVFILINSTNVNAQTEKAYGYTILNFTTICVPWIRDFTLSPSEVYLGQDIAFLVTFSNCEFQVNATSNVIIYKNGELVTNIVKAYGSIGALENATIVSFWTPAEVGDYIASARVIYDENITEPVNVSFKVVSLPSLAPPVVVLPPVVLPPPLPAPAISVDAPREIFLYVNETESFIVFVKNIGNIELFNLSVDFPTLPNISINITPSYFDRIGINETKSFLVKILSGEVGEKIDIYYVKTDKVTVEKIIKIITREKIPPINITEFKLNARTLEEMINSTFRILAIMYAHGYPVIGMFQRLNNASNYLNQSLEAFFEEKYDLAQSLFYQAYSLVQETINETYKIAKEREATYHGMEKILFLIAIVAFTLVCIPIIRFFMYKR